MARILGSLVGDIRGSIGGMTYSRNVSGAYVRARVKPKNPQSVRQMISRYRFGAISQLWRTLMPSQKDGWEVFARNLFNPLRTINQGNRSGIQAFMSLRQSAGQGNEYLGAVQFKFGSDVGKATFTPYNEISTAPVVGISATIKATGLENQLINARNISVAGDGSFRIAYKLPGFVQSPTHPIEIDTFQAESGLPYGFGLYISSPINTPSQQPATRLNINLGDTGIFQGIQAEEGGVLQLSDNITVLVIQDVDPITTKDFPQVGDWVIATPFLRALDGQMKLLSPMPIQVVESVTL